MRLARLLPSAPRHAWIPPSSVESWNVFLLVGVCACKHWEICRGNLMEEAAAGAPVSSIHPRVRDKMEPSSISGFTTFSLCTNVRILPPACAHLAPFSCWLFPEPHQRRRRGRLAVLPAGEALMFWSWGRNAVRSWFPCILSVIQLPQPPPEPPYAAARRFYFQASVVLPL